MNILIGTLSVSMEFELFFGLVSGKVEPLCYLYKNPIMTLPDVLVSQSLNQLTSSLLVRMLLSTE